ncbi:MAG TPA: sugar phosphate isomerase/epimerase family protein [Blastocatellia bacterium]|nr:sugar phosphate isomerase/epimerase family protein [Blastocatellia bacterium]HMV86680.1 sugar phosphate isomerase/epimerase family protein [Blastocatellia bacterium]HMX27450.1 sugar phosphate isomerase/epimerase family protein [Blastocatellia bacterium]HMY74747.1 sugar phosphate isomerase/epimerase family protein [Blastocatellia bacterium]HMZ17153.1 sugar phosphate isomerase/epimerase family protein [Blastocatellia bacterium]
MNPMTRRQFAQSLGAAVAAPAILNSAIWAGQKNKRLPIAFSTLGCPKWDWKTILDQAAQHGYSALELRGVGGEMDLPKSPQFIGAKLKESLKDLEAVGVKISDLGASARLGEPDTTKRAAQLDEARRFVDLAHELKSPYVRVFGGKLLKDQTMQAATELIIAGFKQLHDHAKGSGVTLLIESHDEFTSSESLLAILQGVNLPTAAFLWDAHHTVVTGKEQPADTFKRLGKFVRHTHLKDSVPAGNDRRYVLTGTGEVPIKETVKVLARSGYKGYYCFEWEKRWHPEIEEPEISIPQYAKVMREYLAEAGVKA